MAGTTRIVGMARRCLRSLADGSTGVVVAVSGGADSIALVRTLDIAPIRGIRFRSSWLI